MEKIERGARGKNAHTFGKINKSTRSLQLRSKAHKIDARRCLCIAIFCTSSCTLATIKSIWRNVMGRIASSSFNFVGNYSSSDLNAKSSVTCRPSFFPVRQWPHNMPQEWTLAAINIFSLSYSLVVLVHIHLFDEIDEQILLYQLVFPSEIITI